MPMHGILSDFTHITFPGYEVITSEKNGNGTWGHGGVLCENSWKGRVSILC